MAKRTNYGFEKRQKEAKRKKKQEEKLEKKRLNAEARKGTGAPLDGQDPVATDAEGNPIETPTEPKIE